MNGQLVLMLEIQDMTAKAKEIESGKLGDLERAHFGMDPAAAIETLLEKSEELVEELRPNVRERFRKMVKRFDRAVVPVVGGMCFGCYVLIPTATAGEQDPNADLQSCESCGRFIYILV